MAVRVRPAAVADAPGITCAHVAAWQVAYRGIFPDRFLDDMTRDFGERMHRWEVIIVAPDQPDTVTLVAEREDDDEILGWLSYGPSRDEPAVVPSSRVPGPVGEIYGIYVHPEHWRTGAGTALMGVGLAGLGSDGYREATLWVLERNSAARRFYERHGWREDGARDHFERGGVQAVELRYRRPLSPAVTPG